MMLNKQYIIDQRKNMKIGFIDKKNYEKIKNFSMKFHTFS